jgi:hypothetical protein
MPNSPPKTKRVTFSALLKSSFYCYPQHMLFQIVHCRKYLLTAANSNLTSNQNGAPRGVPLNRDTTNMPVAELGSAERFEVRSIGN